MGMEDADSYSLPEVVRLLNGLTGDVRALSTEVHALGGTFVTRGEFEAWRTAYDRELKDAKSASAPVRVSPWTIAAVIISALVGIGSITTVAITLINVVR